MQKVGVRFKSIIGGESFVENHIGENVDCGDEKIITYSETKSGEKSTTTLIIGKDYLKVEICGAYFAKYEYKKGERFSSEIKTKYGSVPTEISTDGFEIKREDGNIVISAEYDCLLGGEKTRNGFEIKIFQKTATVS